MCKNSKFVLILLMKTWKNPSKVGYFSKIAENVGAAKNGPVYPDSWKLYSFFNDFLYLVQIFGANIFRCVLIPHRYKSLVPTFLDVC